MNLTLILSLTNLVSICVCLWLALRLAGRTSHSSHCCDNCGFGEHYYDGGVNCMLEQECRRVIDATPEDDIPVSDWIYDCNGNNAECDVTYPFAVSWGSNHCRFWEPKTLKSD